MLSWILIALIIAFIFGIIKIETVKDIIKKMIPMIKNAFIVSQNFAKANFEKIKKAIDKQKNKKNQQD